MAVLSGIEAMHMLLLFIKWLCQGRDKGEIFFGPIFSNSLNSVAAISVYGLQRFLFFKQLFLSVHHHSLKWMCTGQNISGLG